jgi:uncharacterized spore protein YtfJ
MARIGPVTVETVRGTPVSVSGRILIPVVRVVSAIGHQGTIREARVEGTGWHVSFVRPLQVIEERNGEVRIYPIRDVTSTVLRQMSVVALVLSVVSMALILVNRLVRDR